MVEVYQYAEPVTAKGFVVMDTPGYDPVSMTGIVAGGANVCVFTTGRGSVFGCKPAPSIKMATNSPLYHHMIDDMDINAGVILDGTPVEEVGEQIFEEILAVASGKKTKSESTASAKRSSRRGASGRSCSGGAGGQGGQAVKLAAPRPRAPSDKSTSGGRSDRDVHERRADAGT